VSALYLFRHGQAGTRARYDTLSDLGREQARKLGESLAAHGVRFTAALSGALERQRQTATEVRQAYRDAGLPFPEIAVDPGWSEFDLDGVYRDVAPVLAAGDAEFRAEYEEMLAQMDDDGHAIHRRWSRCDMAVLRAWLTGQVPVRTESWIEFRARVADALERMAAFRPDDRVAIFTSATPIGIACGAVLGVGDETRIRLTGALYNSAFATLHRRAGEWLLFSFNNVPHLAEESMRTFR
jgi:broad specificity phosphatase PhoE